MLLGQTLFDFIFAVIFGVLLYRKAKSKILFFPYIGHYDRHRVFSDLSALFIIAERNVPFDKKERKPIYMKQINFEIVRAQAQDASALLEYLKIVGGETENLSFGAEGVPLDAEAERTYLGMQAQSCDHIQLLAKANGEIIGTASLNRKKNRMNHRAEFGISVKKTWWGCGVASTLTENILVFARETGVEQINLEVRSDNNRAIALYKKFGFRKLCTFPGFFKINGAYIDFDLMNLELDETGLQAKDNQH